MGGHPISAQGPASSRDISSITPSSFLVVSRESDNFSSLGISFESEGTWPQVSLSLPLFLSPEVHLNTWSQPVWGPLYSGRWVANWTGKLGGSEGEVRELGLGGWRAAMGTDAKDRAGALQDVSGDC